MADAGKYWQRVGHVSIKAADGKEYDYGSDSNALDFKFNIRKPLAAQRMEASIDILGLSMESIHALTCWQPWNVAVARERSIKVYAGYADGGEEEIFSGFIVEAKPTSPPNMWLNVKADNLSFYDKKIAQENKRNQIKFKQYVQELAKANGWRADIASDVEDKDLKGVFYKGPASEIPSYVEHLNDVYAYLENGTLHVVRRIPKNYPNQRGIYTLDMDSGLLGIASLSWDSLVARMRLDTRFRLNDFIWIKSNLYPENSTGAYLINEIEYKGHLRGQEWETVIHAWNYNNESAQYRQNWTCGKS